MTKNLQLVNLLKAMGSAMLFYIILLFSVLVFGI